MDVTGNQVNRRRWLELLVGLLGVFAAIFAVAIVPRWRAENDRGGQSSADPFRIAGNFYFVGASDISAFLVTGTDGHILIDGGHPATPSLILASIEKLGFNVGDVKILLNSEAHGDHAGGLARLQQATGAQLWANDVSADIIAAGGDDPQVGLPMRALNWVGLAKYPPARIDRTFKDGEVIRVGTAEVTAHITPGHSRGCTSYSLAVRDGDRPLNVVSACSLIVLGWPGQYPGFDTDFEQTFKVLRSLPVDIWVTSHGRVWGRYRKYVASQSEKNPVDAFIDPKGYRAYLDDGEAAFLGGIVH